MSKIISVIDCRLAGVSGDMLAAALLDLKVKEEKIIEAMESVKNFVDGCSKLKVSVVEELNHGVKAKKLLIEFKDEKKFRFGEELLNSIKKCALELNFSKEAEEFALNSIKTLIEAEAEIHGVNFEKVKLHESGSVDTLVDIIGVAKAAEELNLFKEEVYATPVAVGKGLFKFSHGFFSTPAPATLEILKRKKFKIIGGVANEELTTPTGAALLTNLASASLSSFPLMIPLSVGYGCGFKKLKEAPNILRIIKGEIEEDNKYTDLIYVLETNLDDASGEVIGYVIERLMNEGAKDASVIPMFTKKNRPGYILKVISSEDKINKLISLIMKETGTLGVRVTPCIRHLALRRSSLAKINLNKNEEQITVKISRSKDGEIIQVKPEYEEAKKIAIKTNKPLKEVYFEAIKKVKENLGKSGRRKRGSQRSWWWDYLPWG